MNLLEKTIILIEDRRFYRHHGIDPIAIVRAFLVNLRERRCAQGGSTITQQLARRMYLHPRKTLLRKISEMLIAIWLEVRCSKDEILKMYVNSVYMGHKRSGYEIVGLPDASQAYFRKDLSDLSVQEIATLVAILRGPNIYRPNTNKGIARRAMVLSVMLSGKLIDRKEFEKAIKET